MHNFNSTDYVFLFTVLAIGLILAMLIAQSFPPKD